MKSPLNPDPEQQATSDSIADPNSARSIQLAEFTRELSARLASLDRGEYLDPALTRARLATKSAARRNIA